MVKNVFFLVMVVIALIRCNPAKNESASPLPIDSMVGQVTQAPAIDPNNLLPAQLIIQGKDIWVRNEPKTGKVVMKLNTGDPCKVLERGPFQMIKEVPHYWYKVEFNAQQGWVFGSQSNIPPPSGLVDAIEFWKGFIRQECKECAGDKSGMVYGKETSTRGDDAEDYSDIKTNYELSEVEDNYLIISGTEVRRTSAAETQKDNFFIATKQREGWALAGKEVGRIQKIYPTQDSYILIALLHETSPSGAMGEQDTWKVYRLPLQQPGEIQSVQTLSTSRSGVFIDVDEVQSNPFVSRSKVSFSKGEATLQLTEEMEIVEENVFETKPTGNPPVVSVWHWDENKKMFVKE